METFEIDAGPCRLRRFRPEDAASVARHADDREVWINLRDRFPHPYTLDDARAWIDRLVVQPAATDFAIEVDGRAVGAIGFVAGEDVSRGSAELGYWLGREYWGRGIASAAVRTLTAELFARPGFVRVHAMVFAWNLASSRVLEKAGFSLEGRLRSAITKDGRPTGCFMRSSDHDHRLGPSSSMNGFRTGAGSGGTGR